MILTIESTSRIVNVNGIDCRLWEGQTESGVKVEALITRIAVKEGQDMAQFEKELREQRPPSLASIAFPLRMIL